MKERPFKKGGLFIYGPATGADGHAHMHVVAPYTEGRFGPKYKSYNMLKGSIDPGELPLQAALREGGEESGIDIKTLLGNAYVDFLAGKVIENAPSGYPGVTIKRASAEPVMDHTYMSAHGAHNRTMYYGIEVEGIDKLRPFLKRLMPDEDDRLLTVKHRAKNLATERDLPTLPQMLAILRTGRVPAGSKPWMGVTEQVILTQPNLPTLEQEWAARHGKQEIRGWGDWKQFCTDMPGAHYTHMHHDFEILKKYFEARGMVGDSGGKMKMDTKDVPLQFYQEAAELLPVNELISRMAQWAERSELYALAGWGEYSGPRREPVNERGMMLRAQLAPLMEFFGKIAPMEVAAGAMTDGKHKLNRRVMRAVDAFVEPVVKSDDWRQRVLAAQPVTVER